jgi:hypothetical protein
VVFPHRITHSPPEGLSAGRVQLTENTVISGFGSRLTCNTVSLALRRSPRLVRAGPSDELEGIAVRAIPPACGLAELVGSAEEALRAADAGRG